MKKALWMILLAWTAGYALPGHTEGNGHDLLRQCTQAVNSFSGTVDPATINFMDAGRCIGQVDGFAGAAAFYESQEGAPGAICFPETGMTVKQSIPRDVLAAHDFLSKAADKRYLLTGKILAEGMGLKSSTITGWEDRTVKFGFVVLRVGKGQWRVERLEGKEGVGA